MKFVEKVVDALLDSGAHTATKYLTDKSVIRATRKLLNGKINRRENVEIVLTMGRPNYREREFIKDCKRAGVTFPVRKVQLRFPPKKKA